MKRIPREKLFYQLFQQPGIAEAELEADVRKTAAMLLYSASATRACGKKRGRLLFGKSETFLVIATLRETLPLG